MWRIALYWQAPAVIPVVEVPAVETGTCTASVMPMYAMLQLFTCSAHAYTTLGAEVGMGWQVVLRDRLLR